MAVRRRRSLILPLHPRRNRCSPILGNYFLGICFTNTRRKRGSPISGDYFWVFVSQIPGRNGAALYRETIFGYLFHKYPEETVQPLYPSFRTSDRRHWCGNPYPRQRRTNRHTSAATGSQRQRGSTSPRFRGAYLWNGSASFSGSGYVSPWVSTVTEAMT